MKMINQALMTCLFIATMASTGFTEPPDRWNVRISFGHRASEKYTVTPQLSAGSPDVEVAATAKTLSVGAGVVDAVVAEVIGKEPAQPPRTPHSIWQYLLTHGEPGQVQRLQEDPGLRPDAAVLTVLTSQDGTRGFSIGLEQLAQHKAMWLPEHDAFVALADAPVDFAAHLASLRGERVLDRVRREPEASLAEWTNKWADIGNPIQWNQPWETSWLGTRGHLTGLVARHGSLYKFGVDRWGSVRPDHASPHKFRFDPLWSDCQWKGQRIVNGLPIIMTKLERAGQRCEIEQFAVPLGNQPPLRLGEIDGVVFTQVRLAGTGPVRFGFRIATEDEARHPELRQVAGRWCVVDREKGRLWLMIEPDASLAVQPRAPNEEDKDPRIEFDCVGQLTEGETRVITLKLASPPALTDAASALAALDFAQARATNVRYWEDWLAQGALFEVPEEAVNDLFRANLWHALMLPRHRTDENGATRIDLPYSNFAYGQLNADWPVNQAVYVDYMLYGLRGYFGVAEDEFAAMYRSQQQADGRVAGYANWGVYSPAMLYSIGQNFLLSGNRASFERLLPDSLKALDWCLGEVAKGQQSKEAPGLIVAPLNDLTKDSRAWAFPNAYFVAGLDLFSRALSVYGHPRADEVARAAKQMRADVERAFARASVRSPVVQLANGTWHNFVPSDAMTPRRLLDVWYPTDVDSGPLHLARLESIEPRGWLTTAMLHDHEDNLFLNQWGMANEPVYNQQATAYLLRDEPEAAIRAFYSMMACAFSHHQLTPLEHRWAWGQYYMPPSTDGAWFELYRNMLVRETDENTLLLCHAAPRRWLEKGQRIRVQQAPTYFGPVSFTVDTGEVNDEITVAVDTPDRKRPNALLVYLRHPLKKPIQSVQVNAGDWQDFNRESEWVRVTNPVAARYRFVVRYRP